MKGSETGKDKVKKICDILRRETLEPAKSEAEEIIENAQRKAEELIKAAQREISKREAESRLELEREKNVAQSSISQACKQALESLRFSIEEKLFNQELSSLMSKHTQDPKVLAQIISAVVSAVEKEGVDADLSVFVPAAVPARSVNMLLAAEVLAKLKEKSVLIGPLSGGVELKLHRENITVDISDVALKELVARYIRKDFRELIFRAL
jgi:V/A-type H+-transporting ATPase subunit E